MFWYPSVPWNGIEFWKAGERVQTVQGGKKKKKKEKKSRIATCQLSQPFFFFCLFVCLFFLYGLCICTRNLAGRVPDDRGYIYGYGARWSHSFPIVGHAKLLLEFNNANGEINMDHPYSILHTVLRTLSDALSTSRLIFFLS